MSYTQFTAEEASQIRDKQALPRMVCLPGGAIGLYFLAFPWPVDQWPFPQWPLPQGPLAQGTVTAFWWLFTAYFFFCWTSCFHETAHQTLCQSRVVSAWVGRFIGTLIFVPYTCYRESHIRHHAYLNKPYDWELWPYASPHCSLAFRRAFAWFELFLSTIGGAIVYGRIYFHKDSPVKNPAIRRAIRNEYLAIVLVWGTAFSLVQYFHVWAEFVRVWMVPMLIAGVMQSIRKFTEHLGLSSFDPLLGTRTVLGGNWITRLSTFVNFDIFIHGPHHRHPRVAHNQLGRKMDDYMAASPETKFPVYSSYLQAAWSMAPFLLFNPGCGVNAGNAPPAGRDDDIRDFVADVTREILIPGAAAADADGGRVPVDGSLAGRDDARRGDVASAPTLLPVE